MLPTCAGRLGTWMISIFFVHGLVQEIVSFLKSFTTEEYASRFLRNSTLLIRGPIEGMTQMPIRIYATQINIGSSHKLVLFLHLVTPNLRDTPHKIIITKTSKSVTRMQIISGMT